MKNKNSNHIKQARSQKLHRAAVIDLLVVPSVVEQNKHKVEQRPQRKRRINYVKKIMNDPYIFSI